MFLLNTTIFVLTTYLGAYKPKTLERSSRLPKINVSLDARRDMRPYEFRKI